MQSVTLPLESWLLCRATRASDNSLAAPAMAGLVQRRGKLNVRFVRFSHTAGLGWRHSTGRDVHIPPLTLPPFGLGQHIQVPGAAAVGGIEGSRTLCWMSAPRGGMSQWKGVGVGERWSRWSWADGGSGCLTEEPKVGCRWVYHRWGEGWRLIWFKKKGQIHPFLAD